MPHPGIARLEGVDAQFATMLAGKGGINKLKSCAVHWFQALCPMLHGIGPSTPISNFLGK
jgi:hypothetical protein